MRQLFLSQNLGIPLSICPSKKWLDSMRLYFCLKNIGIPSSVSLTLSICPSKKWLEIIPTRKSSGKMFAHAGAPGLYAGPSEGLKIQKGKYLLGRQNLLPLVWNRVKWSAKIWRVRGRGDRSNGPDMYDRRRESAFLSAYLHSEQCWEKKSLL